MGHAGQREQQLVVDDQASIATQGRGAVRTGSLRTNRAACKGAHRANATRIEILRGRVVISAQPDAVTQLGVDGVGDRLGDGLEPLMAVGQAQVLEVSNRRGVVGIEILKATCAWGNARVSRVT